MKEVKLLKFIELLELPNNGKFKDFTKMARKKASASEKDLETGKDPPLKETIQKTKDTECVQSKSSIRLDKIITLEKETLKTTFSLMERFKERCKFGPNCLSLIQKELVMAPTDLKIKNKVTKEASFRSEIVMSGTDMLFLQETTETLKRPFLTETYKKCTKSSTI